MKNKKLLWQLPFLTLLVVGTILIIRQQHSMPYRKTKDFIFGTTYHVTYQCDSDLTQSIKAELLKVDASLSPFGRARAGSTRSPLFAGGGVVFGPKPRSFEFSMPQKARKLALKSALSAREESIVIVKDFSAINEPKTKLMAGIIKSLELSGKILVIADTMAEENKNLSLAAGNIPSVKLLLPTNLNVKDLLEADFVVMTEKAVNDITERLQ